MHSRQPLLGARGTREALPPLATAEQVAATIIYLLSEEASNINGAIIARAAAGPPSEKGAGAGYWRVKYG